MNSIAFIRTTLAPLLGKHVLDIGCGKGALAAALSTDGARVTGVDPSPEALTKAREAAPQASFETASAEGLPFADGTFDAAIFSNSLHHVPVPAIGEALAEARRVVKPGGHIVVVEPLVTGTFDTVLKLINDETDIRAAAQGALRDLDRDAGFQRLSSITFTSRETYSDFEAFVARATSADPEHRLPIVAQNRAAIEAAFLRHATPNERGVPFLDHNLKADAFLVR